MAFTAIIVATLVVLSTLIYFISRKKFNYWKKRNIPFLEPKTILGNYGPFILMRETIGEVAKDICLKHPDEPMVGAFFGTEPALIVQDPLLLKLLMTKDYYYFSGREVSDFSHKELFTQSLFFTYGDKWKVLRQNLTPMFSSAKMKNMFYLIESCSKVMERVLDDEVAVNDVQEMRALMARFTMDCIGSCVFGIETRCLEDSANNPFRIVGAQILEVSNFRGSKAVIRAIWPFLFYGLGFKLLPKDAEQFFTSFLSRVFSERQKTTSSRKDFVDLLLEFKKNIALTGDSIKNMKTSMDSEKINIDVSDEILISQCMAFFAAGYETSALTTSLTLYELAKKPECLDKVLEEVDAYLLKHNNKLQYECVTGLPYLDQCISETMRFYPALNVLTREVYDNYTLPNGLKLEKGLRIHVPVYHLHMNPKYFPDPEEYIPERFSPEQKQNITPYTYMPFGEGPRICIGM